MTYCPDIAERIALLAKTLGVDKSGLGRLAGVSKTASGNWFAAKARPERDALGRIHNFVCEAGLITVSIQ